MIGIVNLNILSSGPPFPLLVAPNPIVDFAGGAAFFVAAVCPKPSLATPIPSRSTSALLRSVPPVPVRPGLIGVGLTTSVDAVDAAAFLAAEAASAASSGLYPSFSIRSASSLAFFSAASKSRSVSAITFFAPSLFFFAPRMFGFRAVDVVAVFRIADDVVTGRGAADSEDAFKGDFGRAPLPLGPPGVRNGEAVRLAGVPVLEGGLLGRLIVGLSQDEKKSSAGSPAGVLESPEASSGMSVITTSLGYLRCYEYLCPSTACKGLHVLTFWHLLHTAALAHPCILSPRWKCISFLDLCY
jgi:hypothetical protein